MNNFPFFLFWVYNLNIMDSCLALFFSIFLILLIIRVKKNVTLAILIGSFILGFLTIKLQTLERFFITVTSLETLKLIIIIISAFTLGFSMQELGLLKNLSEKIEALAGKMSLLILPAVVGFLPMPGGALISAIMIRDLVSKYQVKPADATFINYWCRHLWIPIWPLYPSFILAASIVNTSYPQIIKAGYFITLAMIGMVCLFMKNYFCIPKSQSFRLKEIKELFLSLYPLFLVIIFSLVLHIPLVITLPCTVILLYLHKKPGLSQLKKIFSQTLDPGILLLIVGVMFYKDLITYTGSAQVFFEHLKMLHIPTPLAAFFLAFVIGFAVGIEVGFAAIVLPLLINFTGMGSTFQHLHFMLVFGGGFMGIMLSPLHLCLVLSARYYKADLSEVYKQLVPSAVLVSIILWIIYFLKIV